MLRRLIIRDFVLVDFLELEFETGFGTLTGETGAGKSILVDALSFALGERADTGLIRAGCERTEVNVEFDLAENALAKQLLQENDLDSDESASLILRRLLDKNGRSRAYINGSPVTVQQLKEISDSLIDIHGQHAHQSLLKSAAQRLLLDTHAGLLPLADSVAQSWRTSTDANRRLTEALEGAAALINEREQLDWQVRELVALDFSLGEWESLTSEHKRQAHATNLVDGLGFLLTLCSEGETCCETQLDLACRKVEALAEFDPSLNEIGALLQSAQAELSEAASALRRYSDRVEVDPGRLAEIERRIEAIFDCARKFRLKPEELPDALAKLQARLLDIGAATDTDALKVEAERATKHYRTQATELSSARKKAAEKLGKEVSAVMQQLALGGGRFDVLLLPQPDGSVHGLEIVEFRLAGVAGNEARPLAKVASGGELSRISLAIQTVTSQASRVPTLIFDEVDVGIGGGVAEVVGKLLRALGQERQVLCVTHLPQVAAQGNWQWQVVKHAEQGAVPNVRSEVILLDQNGRIDEVARMLGGVEITDLTRQHAQEMLGFL